MLSQVGWVQFSACSCGHVAFEYLRGLEFVVEHGLVLALGLWHAILERRRGDFGFGGTDEGAVVGVVGVGALSSLLV